MYVVNTMKPTYNEMKKKCMINKKNERIVSSLKEFKVGNFAEVA